MKLTDVGAEWWALGLLILFLLFVFGVAIYSHLVG